MTCEKRVCEQKLTRRAAAEYLDYEYDTLEKRARKGLDPPCHKNGGRYYYYQSDLDAFDKQRQTF